MTPPPPPRAAARASHEEEDDLSRSKALELDVPTRTVLNTSVRAMQRVVSELRAGEAGALDELELASMLTARIPVLLELQKRLVADHGAVGWAVVARCIGTLKLVAAQLREVDVSQQRPGAHAARSVMLTKQAAAMQQLSVRLRPAQEAVCVVRSVW